MATANCLAAGGSNRQRICPCNPTISDDRLEALVLDLLEWVAAGARPYAEVMDAWRTSCPRLPVWEEAVARGLLVAQTVPGRGIMVAVTPVGSRLLAQTRPLRR